MSCTRLITHYHSDLEKSECIVYQARVVQDNNSHVKTYAGLTGDTFKGKDTSLTLTTRRNMGTLSWPDIFGSWRTSTSLTPSPRISSAGCHPITLSQRPADCAPLKNIYFIPAEKSKPQPTDGIIFTLSPSRQTPSFPPEKKENVNFTQMGHLCTVPSNFNPILPVHFYF